MDPRKRIPYGTGGDTLGSLGLLDQPQREPSHLNAITGLLDHYTMGLPSALAGLNPFGGGYAAAREAADRGKSDARQLYGGDALSLADAFGGMVPSRIPTAGADAQGLARALQAGGSKVDDALTAGVRMMPEGVGSMGGVPPRTRPEVPAPHPDGPRNLQEELARLLQQNPTIKPKPPADQAAELEALRRRFELFGDAGLKSILIPLGLGAGLMGNKDQGSAAP